MLYAHIRTTQQRHEHINTFKAAKDIPAGQEVFARYGSAQWFASKNVPYADADYANTMWRPEHTPLPCRQSVRQITTEDGRHTFSVHVNTIPAGTVVEISLCVEVSLNVVDQIPVLWDFVIMDETTQTVCVREDAEVC